MKKTIQYLFLSAMLFSSCTTDSDICTSGEATPRMKVKFRDSNNKITTLDEVYIDINYGTDTVNVVSDEDIDSVYIPLRVDESTSTELLFRTSEDGPYSKIQLDYTTESEYVSPACGIKKMYYNLTGTLVQSNPVVSIQQEQTEITDESKTVFYFNF